MTPTKSSHRRLLLAALATATAAAIVSSVWTVTSLATGSTTDDVITGLAVTVSLLVLAWCVWASLYVLDLRRLARQAQAQQSQWSQVDRGIKLLISTTEKLERRPSGLLPEQLDERLARLDPPLMDLSNRIGAIAESTSKKARDESNADLVHSLYPLLEGLVAVAGTAQTENPPLPPMRDWAVSPDLAAYLLNLTLDSKPDVVVELGSGVSTAIFGLALKVNGSGKVYALEHDEAHFETTRKIVQRHDIADHVELVLAPLRTYEINDEPHQWYETEAIEQLEKIDLLFVDGPPGNIGTQSRYPTLPLLIDRLQSGSVVVLDDADREHEVAMVETWQKDFGPLATKHLSHEKGTLVLHI